MAREMGMGWGSEEEGGEEVVVVSSEKEVKE